MKYLTYTPICGDSIFNAAEGAIKMSRTKYYYTYREVNYPQAKDLWAFSITTSKNNLK
jgi:hypothetical protein